MPVPPQSRPPQGPAELADALTEERVREVLAAAPPLTAEQRRRLAELLSG